MRKEFAVVSLQYLIQSLHLHVVSCRWFCIADDDTYINIPNLLSLLQGYDYTMDWYIGRPSLKYPIRVTIDDMVS